MIGTPLITCTYNRARFLTKILLDSWPNPVNNPIVIAKRYAMLVTVIVSRIPTTILLKTSL